MKTLLFLSPLSAVTFRRMPTAFSGVSVGLGLTGRLGHHLAESKVSPGSELHHVILRTWYNRYKYVTFLSRSQCF
jgi:hypothetical protein